MPFRIYDHLISEQGRKNYVMKQKVKVAYIVCLVSFLAGIYISIINLFVTGKTLLYSTPPITVSIIMIFCFLLIRRKKYWQATNMMLITIFTATWIQMFSDTIPITKIDTISFIIGGLALTPFAVYERKAGITFYYIVNIIVFIFFSLSLRKHSFFTNEIIVEYFTDNIIIMILNGFISYQFFKIHKNALNSAVKSESFIRQERDFSRMIVEKSPVLICFVDNDDRILTVNPMFEEVLGYEMKELMGKTWNELFGYDVPFSSLIDNIAVSAIKSKKGTDKIINWTIYKTRRGAENISGTIIFGNDVTEQKNADCKIMEMNKGLEDKVNERTREIESTNRALVHVTSETGKLIKNLKEENSRNTLAVNQLLNETVELAEKGVDEMFKMTEFMSFLSSAVKNIARINKNIDDLAFQTNILAINASIEAARAGNKGRGFAIVAKEVRNLAEKSADESYETSMQLKKAFDLVFDGNKTAKTTAKSLDDINDSVNRMKDLIHEVSESVMGEVEKISDITAKGR